MSKELWKIVGSGGVTEYKDAEELWKKAEQYFEWCDNTPIKSKRTLQSGKEAGKKVELEHTRPYALKGLCLYCGINEAWLKEISSLGDKTNIWYLVIEKIMYVIYNQNVEGAFVDIFNPIMVTKVLGMDKPTEDEGRVTRVEIVDSTSNKLANSENEILKNLNQEKVQIVKDKSENLLRANAENSSGHGDLKPESENTVDV